MLQFLHGSGGGAGFVELRGSFVYQGHLCLVFERLRGSLSERITAAAELASGEREALLCTTAHQLLVRFKPVYHQAARVTSTLP